MATGTYLIKRLDRRVDDVRIETDGLTIGRAPDNELVLNHRSVEPTHAGIQLLDGQQYWLISLSSASAVMLNRQQIERAPIATGDVVQIGPWLLHISQQGVELTITVEVGAGVRTTRDTAAADPSLRPVAAAPPDQAAIDVFWDKRKRESGKMAEASLLDPRAQGRTGKALVSWAPTLDLRLPWPPAYFILGALAVIVLTAVALIAYRPAYSPGPVSKHHRSTTVPSQTVALRAASGQCSACHSPIVSMESRCAECHQPVRQRLAISTAHRNAGLNCASCHREHEGRATLASAVCADCHTATSPVHEGRLAGRTLGEPHPRVPAYPVRDGQWRGQLLRAADWQARSLPTYWADRPLAEQFHAVHRAVATASGRLECGVCHGNRPLARETKPVALAGSCAKCHVSDRDANACVTCHPPHGTSRPMRPLIAKNSPPPPVFTSAATTAQPGHWPTPWWMSLAAAATAMLVSLTFFLTRHRTSLAQAVAHPPAPTATPAIKLREGAPSYPHPVVDPLLCIGCHACVDACPHDVLDIVNGVATPVALDQCMEDTACMVECPTSPKACVVVNTTKKIPPRKVPRRNAAYLTDVQGIYLIGDVAGVPLIKNALNEGFQVIQALLDDLRQDAEPASAVDFDVAIIGAGPAGFSATVNARENGLRCITLEQGRLANTLRGYPAGKYVFFKPDTVTPRGLVPLPGAGGRKEELLDSWLRIAQGVDLREEERCSAIESLPGGGGGFNVKTATATGTAQYRARRVVLAIGNSGSPMKLGVPGEDLPKVKYSLSDPADYVGRKCIVVGAGNSAIEAAVDLARGGNEVTLVVRSDFKGDLKLGNKMNIYDCMEAKTVKVMFRTTIQEITSTEVALIDARTNEPKARIGNDVIFALIGSERPTKFLQALGIKIG